MNLASNNKSDPFALMLAIFTLLTLALIVTPPLLMLNYYLFAQQHSNQTQQPLTRQIIIPKLPESLTKPPQRWRDNIVQDPFNQQLTNRIGQLIDKERQSVQRPPLVKDSALAEIATRHSRDMAAKGYLDHYSTDGDGPIQRVAMLNRQLFGFTFENITKTTSPANDVNLIAEQLMTSWMNSLSQRRNILRDGITHFGVGCAQQIEQKDISYYCTQIFTEQVATALMPIDSLTTKGSSVSVTLTMAEGLVMAADLVLSTLDSDIEMGKVSLVANGGSLTGKLKTDVVGMYGLSLSIPDKTGGYRIIPGPYVQVKE